MHIKKNYHSVRGNDLLIVLSSDFYKNVCNISRNKAGIGVNKAGIGVKSKLSRR